MFWRKSELGQPRDDPSTARMGVDVEQGKRSRQRERVETPRPQREVPSTARMGVDEEQGIRSRQRQRERVETPRPPRESPSTAQRGVDIRENIEGPATLMGAGNYELYLQLTQAKTSTGSNMSS
jgi:hypothetical protein